MVFNCEICGYKTTTEGGMRLHQITSHKDESLEEKVKVSAPVKKTNTEPKGKTTLVSDIEAYAAAKLARYNAMMKKWPKKSPELKDGDKISKKDLMKIFPKETDVYINARMSNPVPLHSKLEPSYKITVKGMKKEWIAVHLVGKKHKITWKEGPTPKKYKVMIPLLQTKWLLDLMKIKTGLQKLDNPYES